MRKNGQKESKPRTLQIAQKRLGTTDVFDHYAEAIPVVAEPLPANSGFSSAKPSSVVPTDCHHQQPALKSGFSRRSNCQLVSLSPAQE